MLCAFFIFMWHRIQPIICKYCNTRFKPNYEGKIYCCKDCYTKDHNVSKICLNCGKEFIVKKGYISKMKRNIYCSAKCYLELLDKKKSKYIPDRILFYDLKKFCKYEISKCGLVRNKQTYHIRKPGITRKGYLQIRIEKRTVKIHRLVALNFLPNPFGLSEVNHKDGNKLNNKIENLEWVSSGDNQRHSYKLGLREPVRKRNIEIGFKIEDLLKEQKSMSLIARELGVKYGTVRYYMKIRPSIVP